MLFEGMCRALGSVCDGRKAACALQWCSKDDECMGQHVSSADVTIIESYLVHRRRKWGGGGGETMYSPPPIFETHFAKIYFQFIL